MYDNGGPLGLPSQMSHTPWWVWLICDDKPSGRLHLTHPQIRPAEKMATNQQSQLFGGSGGKAFDDLEKHPTIVGIRGLIVRSGTSIDSFQAVYQLKDGSTVVGPRHGGLGGSEKRFMLDEGEVLIGMEGKTSGVLVDQLTFYSNRGRQYGPYGRSYTMPFKTGGTDLELTSFFGRSGKLVDALGVRFTQNSPQGSSSNGNLQGLIE